VARSVFSLSNPGMFSMGVYVVPLAAKAWRGRRMRRRREARDIRRFGFLVVIGMYQTERKRNDQRNEKDLVFILYLFLLYFYGSMLSLYTKNGNHYWLFH